MAATATSLRDLLLATERATQPLDAAVRRFAEAATADARALTALLDVSPQAEPLVLNWPDEAGKGSRWEDRESIALFLELVTKLLHAQAHERSAKDAAEALSLKIVREKSASLEKMLSWSDKPIVEFRVLELMAMIVSVSASCARELVRIFNFQSASFIRIATRRMKKATVAKATTEDDEAPEHDGITLSATTSTTKTPNAAAAVAVPTFQIRAAYVRLVAALAACPDRSVHRFALKDGGVVASLFKSLDGDDAEMLATVTDHLETLVLLNDNVDTRGKMAIFNNAAVQQLVTVVKSDDEDIASQVSSMLSRLLLEDGALYHLPARQSVRLFLLKSAPNAALSVEAHDASTSDSTGETTNVTVKVIRGVIGSICLNDYIRSSQVRGLVSKLLREYPGLTAEFVSTLGPQLEPKTGYRWFCVASMVQNVLAIPLDAMLTDLHASVSQTGDSTTTYTAQVLASRLIVPLSCRKELSRGLQHANNLIIYASLGLIECALRRFQFVQANLPPSIPRSELENELRFLFPSPETLVSLLMKLCAGVDKAALVYLRALTVFRLYLECLPLAMSESKADFTKLLAWQYLDGVDGNTSSAMRGVIVGEILRVLMVVDESRLRNVVTSGATGNGEVSKLSQLLRIYTSQSAQAGEASRSLARAVLFRVFVALKVFGSRTDVSSPSEEINVWLDNMSTGGDATTAFVEIILQSLLSDPFAFLLTSAQESVSPSPAALALIAVMKNNWPLQRSVSKLDELLHNVAISSFASRVLMALMCQSAEPTLVARLLCADDSATAEVHDSERSTKKRRRSDSIDLASLTPFRCVIAIAQVFLTPTMVRKAKASTAPVSDWKPAATQHAFGEALFCLQATAFIQHFPKIVEDLLRLQLQSQWLHHYIGARPDVDVMALKEVVQASAKKNKLVGPVMRDLVEALPLNLISQRILFALCIDPRGTENPKNISEVITELKTRVGPAQLSQLQPHVIALVSEQLLNCIEIVRHNKSTRLLDSLSDVLLSLQAQLGTADGGETSELGSHRLHTKLKRATLLSTTSSTKLRSLALLSLARAASDDIITDAELRRLRHSGSTIAAAVLARHLPTTLRLGILNALLSKTSSHSPLVAHIIETLNDASSTAGFKHDERLAHRVWNSVTPLQAVNRSEENFRVLSAGLHVVARLGGVTEAVFRDSVTIWAKYLRHCIDRKSEDHTVSFDQLILFVSRLGAVIHLRDIIAAPSPAFNELIHQLLRASYTNEYGRLTAVAAVLVATYGSSSAIAAQEHAQDAKLLAQSIQTTLQVTVKPLDHASLGLIVLRHAALTDAHHSSSQLTAIQKVLLSRKEAACPSTSQLLALLLSLRRADRRHGPWPSEIAVFLVRSAITYAIESDANNESSQRTLQALHLMLRDLLQQAPNEDDVRGVMAKIAADIKRLFAMDLPSDTSAFYRFVRASRAVTSFFEQQPQMMKSSMKNYSISDHFKKLTSHELFSASLRDSAISVELLLVVASMLRLGGTDLYARTVFQHLLGAYDVSLSLSDRMIRSLLEDFESKAGILASQYGYRFGSSCLTEQSQKQDGSVRSDLIEDSAWLFNGGLEPTRIRATIEWFPLNRGILVANDAALLVDDVYLNGDFEDECADVEESSRAMVYDPSYLLPMFARYVASSALPEAAMIQQGVVGVALRAVSSNADDVREYAYAILAHVHESLSADAATDFKPGRQVHLMLDTLRNALQDPLEGVSSAITVFMNDTISILGRPNHTMYPHVNHFLLARPAFDLSDVPMFYSLFNSHSPQTYKQERSWLLHGLRRGVREDADVSLLIRRHVPSILLSFFGSDLADDHTQLLVCSILVAMLKTEAGAQYLLAKCAFLEWLTARFHEASNATTPLSILHALCALLEESLKTSLWDDLEAPQHQALGSTAVNCYETLVVAVHNRRELASEATKVHVARIALLVLQRAAVACSLSTFTSVFSLLSDELEDSTALDCVDECITERLLTHHEFQRARFVDWSKLLSRVSRIIALELRTVLSGEPLNKRTVAVTLGRELQATASMQRLRRLLAQAPALRLLVLEDLADDLTTCSLVLFDSMSLDAIARHVFAYGGTQLQMADEHTLVAVAGNALQFSSTVTHSQHFLLRAKPRKMQAFDVNWRNAEIAVTSRDPNPEVLVYTYPDKKLRGKLQNGAVMEYAQLKYSRCGRRLLTVRADDIAPTTPTITTTTPTSSSRSTPKRLCVWDMDKLEPLKGCANATVTLDVEFASFDPSNADHFVLGGDDGLQLWKIYKGRASYTLRHVTIQLTDWTTMVPLGRSGSQPALGVPPSTTAAVPSVLDTQDLQERRQRMVCHTWMRQGRVLVANRAGELVIIDTAATVQGSELTGVLLPGATRANRCVVVGVVYTTETIIVVYADGYVAWLDDPTGELLQGTTLPGYSAPPVADATLNLIASVAPSPNFSKVYVGTVDGHIYELKVSIAIDDEDELDDDVNSSSLGDRTRAIEDPSLVASRLISSCGSFHRGAVLAAAALTPSGGTLTNDLVVATGGSNGRLYIWSATKCRGMGETNVAALFAAGVSALLPTGDGTGSLETTVSSGLNATDGTVVSSTIPAAVADRASSSTDNIVPVDLPSIVITALVARPADPLLLVGDLHGKLRALCVAKIVGGNGALEFLPLHAIQLLPPQRALDVLELHPTQPFVLAASTSESTIFVLSLDHEKHFAVLAYVSLPASIDTLPQDERIVDVKWSVPPHSPAALSFTFYTTAGKLCMARYQDTGTVSAAVGVMSTTSTLSLPVPLKFKPIAYSDVAFSPKCQAMQFFTDAPVNVLLATAPHSGDLLLLKYADLVIDPNEKVPLQSKVLAQDAHEPPGVAAIAVYGQRLRNGEQLIATAGVTGAVTIWVLSFSGSSALQTSELHLDDVQAVKKKTLLLHLGVVTSLSFVSVGADGDVYLVTTGVDGCVYFVDVRLSSAIAGPTRPDPTASPLFLNIANFAKYEDPFKPEQDAQTEPLLSVVQDQREAIARNRFDRLKDKTRAHLNDLERKLKVLLTENDKLPESERLGRDEFVINTEWRDKLMRKNHARALAVRDSIQRELAKMNVVRERMKLEFWDSASTPGVKLRGLTPPTSASATSNTAGSSSAVSSLFVYNFPMRKQTKQETLRVKRIELLRLIEYEHQKAEVQLATTRGSSTTGGGVGMRGRTPEPPSTAPLPLVRFHEVVPPNLQWLIGAGSNHPSLNRWINEKMRQASAAPLAPATSTALPSKDIKPPSDAAAIGSVVPAGTSPLVSPVVPATLNDAKSFHLVYHPVAVRTRKQQRTQIQLLKCFVRFQVAEFNREFQELVTLKETKMEEIDAKNARIQEIANELGNPHATSDLFRPTLAPDEIATSILDVSPEEMTQTPYESEDARRAREKEAAEKAELECQRQKDDVAGRALKDMMDGTLDVKKENLVNQTLSKEQWMVDTPVDYMTADQKKLLAQFEAAQQKLKEEQEKYKKSLDLELKKIRTEIQEICKSFDDKLRALQDVALSLKTTVLAQQLYELRLADDLMEHEHLVGEIHAMETAMTTLQQEICVCEKENELFAVQVETCKDEWHRAVDEDKTNEKGFLRELEETLATQGVALDHDLVKHLVELYKKRKAEDVRIGYGAGLGLGGFTGSGGGGGPKRGKSSANLRGSSVGSKQRLLAEAGSEQSSRTLAAATLLQNLQTGTTSSSRNLNDRLDGENNFDPFLGIEMPTAASADASSVTRHVVPLDYEVDRPDGLMMDDRVWRALNDLRTKKILTEHTVRDKAEQLAHTKAVADELQVKLHEVQEHYDDDRAALAKTAGQLRALAENAPLLVHIKQGQDETGCNGSGDEIFRNAMAPSHDSLLVARASVESLNDVIQLHGKDQVGVLTKIKNFRKNINVMEWEHALLEMQTRDMEERYTDIQLLRVTKELQELFHTGDTSQKQKRELALLEAKMDHLGKHHQNHLLKLDAEQSKLDRQLRERLHENESFAAQVAQLEMQVQIREDIVMSRKSAALRTGSSTDADDNSDSAARLKAITVRRKLVDLARAQTEEIEFLRMELDKMRRRTFPTFAQQHASANHGGGGGGVDSHY